jgi:hypothetical protein
MERKDIFTKIYKNGIWNDNCEEIPKSGPGSSINNTKNFRDFFDIFCEKNNIQEVLDIGCGDLTWMPLTKMFRTKTYTGIDIVPSLIETHKIKYPQHNFMCFDVVSEPIPYSEVICIRDVLFHLSIEDIQILLGKIKCKYLFVTSCRNEINNNSFNQYHYHPVNVKLMPFLMTENLDSMYEPEFDRDVFIYQFLSQ